MQSLEILAKSYGAAAPFPHIVIDDALDLVAIEAVESEVRRFQNWDGEKNFAVSSRKRRCAVFAKLPPKTQELVAYLNGPDFLGFLERLTGIGRLISDSYLYGGGIHSIRAGGFLKIHADFNWHERLQAYRRLNLLLYLNSDWEEAWGGALELWDREVSAAAVRIPPVINRMVIFNTTDTSFHGHPDPLTCPEDRARNSIALYYYTAESAEEKAERGKSTETDYRTRPGERF